MITSSAPRRVTVATSALFCFGAATAAPAQDASAWDEGLHAAARLIAGKAFEFSPAGIRPAGIEIRLDPGWKTYWRYPGDSGVPPTIDFAGSENIKSVTTQWPAPERFADGAGGYSIGYVGIVVLPLDVTPADATKPSLLHVKLGYAVCGNLCIPAQAELGLTLSGKTGVEDQRTLAAAKARVPRRIALGASSNVDGIAVRSVRRERDDGHERIVVEVAESAAAPVDLFVEGPTPDWALPLPKPSGPAMPASAGEPRIQRFTFDLDGLPPGARGEGATLTFTVVSPADAIEVEARLD
jgi:DsbC/DsbD-like thiol-disulfide interchange protein